MAGSKTSEADRIIGAVETSTHIKQIARELNTLGSRKCAHLLNVSLATFKYLCLYGESDNLRLAAAKAVLEVPTIKSLAASLRTRQPRVLHQHVHLNGALPEAQVLEDRLKAMLAAGGDQAKQAIEALEAELVAPTPAEAEPNE